MVQILDTIETDYVDCQTLLAYLGHYSNPRDWIARMVKKGELIRLKNGFFLIASRFQRGNLEYPYEQLANRLYGPSYISLEWALSFYDLIPERVSVVTSVTTGMSKEFNTPIVSFNYRHLSHSRYSIGIDQKQLDGQLGGFLIATPEKALADWIFFADAAMSEKELFEDLTEAKRIEPERLQDLNQNLLKEIAEQYKSQIVRKLYIVIRSL